MITGESVTKTYGAFTAVDDVSFTASAGRVTGFLGPNGAGKSTTLRIVTGLTPPTRGSAHVAGRRFADLPNPGFEVGVLLDASAQHAGRTGREILRLSQQMMGLPRRRVDEMLDLVSLTPTEAGRRVRGYSLGMRQRLGIAHALLGDPQVLILDEPANGLDPAGIRWMRDLLRGYADPGATVLLSSHLLHDIEVVADDIVVIGNGRILAQGTKADLLASAGTHLRTRHPADLKAALDVELRKSFDTRAGRWLLASVGLASVLTSGAVIAWAPDDDFTYSTFTTTIAFPMSVILPIIAALAVTAEWTQRSGLTTFTVVPHRGRVMLGKAIALVSVALPATAVALVVGAGGNVVGSWISGNETVWDQDFAAASYLLLSLALSLAMGLACGTLIRNSAGAIVAFRDVQPWVDLDYQLADLLQGSFDSEQWSQLAATSALWLLLPLTVGLWTLVRSEVK